MKKNAIILKVAGLILLVLGFIIPWYFWNAELVGDRVVVNMFGAGGTWISAWQLIIPQTLVHDVPASSSQYLMMQGISPADVLKGVGITWAIVPILVLLLLIAAFLLIYLARAKEQAELRDGFGSLIIGGCILLMLLLWNPATPAPLEKLGLTPSFGKYLAILGASVLTLSGLINLLVKPSVEQQIMPQIASESQAPKFRTCLKCHESVAANMAVCPHCGNQMN